MKSSPPPGLLDGPAAAHMQKLSALMAPVNEVKPTIHVEISIASS
jgi:hypothetical protein